MTLEEAIKKEEELVRINQESFNEYSNSIFTEYALSCKKCAENHRQIAEWYKELQKYRELFSCPEEAEEVLNMHMV